jgi:hypothetical protein
VLTPPGAPIIARHRARTILTPLEVRRAILEDVASKPEAVRVRSLRRRLTILDRMLTDQEAEALERLTTCINALSNVRSIDYLKPEVRYTPLGRLPFSEKRRREISAMSYVLKNLSAPIAQPASSWLCCLIPVTAAPTNLPRTFSPRFGWLRQKWFGSMTSGIGAKGKPAFNDHVRASWHLDPSHAGCSCSAFTGTGGVAGACSGGALWKGLGQDSPFKRHSRVL